MSNGNRVSLLDKTALTYDEEEQRILADRIDIALQHFLTRDATHFRGWVVKESNISRSSIEYTLVPPSNKSEITLEHMKEVSSIPFSLSVSVKPKMNYENKSVGEVRECVLVYDIIKEEKMYYRTRIMMKILSVMLLLFLVGFFVSLVLLLKHTEDDSHPLEPVWRFFE
jgi:hypothetical protein